MGASTLKTQKTRTGPSFEARRSLESLNDSGVVQAFLDGEQRAFGELVKRYDSRLLNFVYRTVGDRERAQDLVQETFVRVYRHLHRFDQSKKFSTWIYTIASNLAKNELRNRSRNPLVLFQTIKRNWDADHRPLEWEEQTRTAPTTSSGRGTCRRRWRRPSRSCRSITGSSSSSGSWRGRPTRRSPTSPG